VQHAPAGGLELVRAREHVHDFERLDFFGAARRRGRAGDSGGIIIF
jgi:hypothetical protein